jgi:hypothetical protein
MARSNNRRSDRKSGLHLLVKGSGDSELSSAVKLVFASMSTLPLSHMGVV